MSGYTPGPWVWNDPSEFRQVPGEWSDVAVYAPGTAFPWRMAEVSGPDEATMIANARLIAAAPELLEAATAMIKAHDEEWPTGEHDARTALRDAIAKATEAAS